MDGITPTVIDALRGITSLLAFRLLPFVAWTSLTRELSLGARALVLALYGLLLLAVLQTNPTAPALFATLGLGIVYFSTLGLGVHRMAGAYRAGQLTRDVVLLLCAVFALIAPGVIATGSYRTLLLVFGFEVLFASYSYCIESGSRKVQGSLRDCIFFLLVNPALVFTHRGQRVGQPALSPKGLLRMGLGLLTLCAHVLVFGLLAKWPSMLQASDLFLLRDLEDYGRFAALFGIQGVALYLVHSGIASLQTGAMRMLGHEIPERYDYPLFAKSPAEFWQRWNTYVGHWIRIYVFYPVVSAIRRRTALKREMAQSAAIVAAFLATATVHGLFQYVNVLWLPGGVLLGFGIHAALIICWNRLVELAARLRRQLGRPPRERRGPVALALANLCVLQLLLLANWILLPALAGQTLPDSVSSFFAPSVASAATDDPHGAIPAVEVCSTIGVLRH